MRTILVTCTVASAAPAIASVPVLARPQRLSDSLGQANDAAGYAVAAAGDLVLVGSRGADPGAQNAGKVCVFRRSGAGWVQAGNVAEPVAPVGMTAYWLGLESPGKLPVTACTTPAPVAKPPAP